MQANVNQRKNNIINSCFFYLPEKDYILAISQIDLATNRLFMRRESHLWAYVLVYKMSSVKWTKHYYRIHWLKVGRIFRNSSRKKGHFYFISNVIRSRQNWPWIIDTKQWNKHTLSECDKGIYRFEYIWWPIEFSFHWIWISSINIWTFHLWWPRATTTIALYMQ